MKTYTIKRIAELAGVSKGTVDRVLHKRGKVSAKALAKVSEVLKEIDYKPNLLARSLKNTKTYHICVVLPDSNIDSFWKPCNDGIQEAIDEFASFGIFIEPFLFDPREVDSFKKVNAKVLTMAPDAVLIAPLFHKETVQIVHEYKNLNTVISKFNNPVEIENTQNFVGQDLYRSGRVAGNLMDAIRKKESGIGIIHIDEDIENAVYIKEKERGFRDYFKEKEKSYQIETYNLKEDELKVKLNGILSANAGVKSIFVTTSKIHRVAQYIHDRNLDDVKLIGYDLLPENIDFLLKKNIRFLIHQNPRKQVYLGIKFLVDFFLFDKRIPAKSLLPIDIISSENIASYIDESK